MRRDLFERPGAPIGAKISLAPIDTAVALRDVVVSAWRQTGAALVGPLLLVGATGLLVLFGYNSNPDAANDGIARAPLWFDVARSLHLWSSRALLAGGAIHTAWTWRDRRVAGAHRTSYLLGAALLGLLAVGHATGHILRWDAAGQRLAQWMHVSGGLALPLHAAILGLVTLLVAAVHVGRVRGGTHARMDDEGRRAALAKPALVAIALVVAAAVAFPAPVQQRSPPWPTGIFQDAATWGGAWAFALAAVTAWTLVAAQPFMKPWLGLATRILLGLVFVASFAR